VYTVSFLCGRNPVSAKFTVLTEDKKPQPKPDTKPTTPRPSAQVTVKPKGAAETGGGDVADASGPGTGTFVLGGTALVATVGAGAFAFRRLRKEN
jgi:hypothetical protein